MALKSGWSVGEYFFKRLYLEMKKRMVLTGALGVKGGILHYLLLLMVEPHRAVTECNLVPRSGEESPLHYGRVTLVAVESVA